MNAGRFADPWRGSSSERGYDATWRKLRDHVMRRDCRLCQPCKDAGRVTPARHVDHIVPKCQRGGRWPA